MSRVIEPPRLLFSSLYSVVAPMDDKHVISVRSGDGFLTIHNLQTRTEVKTIRVKSEKVITSLACTPNKHYAIYPDDGNLRIRSLVDEESEFYAKADEYINKVVVTNDYVFTRCRDGLDMWSIKERKNLTRLSEDGHLNIATSRDGRYLVTCPTPCLKDSNNITIWTLPTGSVGYESPIEKRSVSLPSVCTSLSLTPDSKYIIATTYDGRICGHVIRIETGEKVNSFRVNCHDPPDHCNIVPLQHNLLAIRTGGIIAIRNFLTGEKVGTLRPSIPYQNATMFATGNHLVVTYQTRDPRGFGDMIHHVYDLNLTKYALKEEEKELRNVVNYLQEAEGDSLLALMLRGVLIEHTSLLARI